MPLGKAEVLSRAKKIRLLAMDVDGVLTGGDIVLLQSGEEIKFWNAKDRLGLALVRDSNIPLILAWITGRSSTAVSEAARDLGVRHVVQKCKDKKAALEAILKKHRLGFEQAAFIGDDLIDLAAMGCVGLSDCPADATPDVIKRADYISTLPGGRGAVRDVLELILRAQNKWDSLVASVFS